MAVVRCLRPVTGQSIAEIRKAIDEGSPLFQQELFFNNHDEIADRLRRILANFDDAAVACDVYEDEHQISATVLRNILDARDQRAQSDHI